MSMSFCENCLSFTIEWLMVPRYIPTPPPEKWFSEIRMLLSPEPPVRSIPAPTPFERLFPETVILLDELTCRHGPSYTPGSRYHAGTVTLFPETTMLLELVMRIPEEVLASTERSIRPFVTLEKLTSRLPKPPSRM